MHSYTCTECGETEEFSGEFLEAKENAKSKGWKFWKEEDGDNWYYYCKKCG